MRRKHKRRCVLDHREFSEIIFSSPEQFNSIGETFNQRYEDTDLANKKEGKINFQTVTKIFKNPSQGETV